MSNANAVLTRDAAAMLNKRAKMAKREWSFTEALQVYVKS
jgi:hypothetical protein